MSSWWLKLGVIYHQQRSNQPTEWIWASSPQLNPSPRLWNSRSSSNSQARSLTSKCCLLGLVVFPSYFSQSDKQEDWFYQLEMEMEERHAWQHLIAWWGGDGAGALVGVKWEGEGWHSLDKEACERRHPKEGTEKRRKRRVWYGSEGGGSRANKVQRKGRGDHMAQKNMASAA